MKIISSLVVLIFAYQLPYAQSAEAKIDSIVSIVHTKNPDVSISIGVIQGGKEYYLNYGTVSHDSQLQVDERTIYPIGSITKLLTANLIAQAQLEGKLNVNDFIDEYLPDDYILPKNMQHTIKISDLGSHQSGLPNFDFQQLMETNPRQPLNITKKTIQSTLNDSLELIDYGCYRYSNFGYTLLGVILKEIYAKDYSQLVKEKILVPGSMDLTLTTDFKVTNRITGYDQKGTEQELWNWNELSAPAGLIKSNTRDMIRFLRILLSGQSAISNTAKITENTYFKNTIREVGFGQQIHRIGDDMYFFKTGNTFSASSIIAYDKMNDWGVIILINQQNLGLIDELMSTIYEDAFSN